MIKHFLSSPCKTIALAVSAGVIAVMAAQAAHAYSPEGDLMRIKGYSPEIIKTTEAQRSRQEWRQAPAATRTPVEKFFHNIYYGEWTGSMDDFGAQVLRETD